MESLRANFALSNTPDFLFRRFRRDPNVLALAQKSPAELRAMAVAKLIPGASSDDILEGYAAIVALSHKDRSQIELELVALEAVEHYWARQLVEKVKSTFRISETRSEVQLRPPAATVIVVPGSSAPNTTSTVVVPTLEPKLIRLTSSLLSNNESTQ